MIQKFEEMSKVARRIVYLLLVVVCIPPLVLRKVDGALEPYPSILLPAGANQVRISQENESSGKLEGAKILAWNQEKEKYEEINSELIVDGLHQLYWDRLAGKNFHLYLGDDSIIRQDEIFGQIKVINRRNVDKKDIDQAKQWIRERLRINSYKDSIILIRSYEFRVKGSKAQIESINDEVIQLY